MVEVSEDVVVPVLGGRVGNIVHPLPVIQGFHIISGQGEFEGRGGFEGQRKLVVRVVRAIFVRPVRGVAPQLNVLSVVRVKAEVRVNVHWISHDRTAPGREEIQSFRRELDRGVDGKVVGEKDTPVEVILREKSIAVEIKVPGRHHIDIDPPVPRGWLQPTVADYHMSVDKVTVARVAQVVRIKPRRYHAQGRLKYEAPFHLHEPEPSQKTLKGGPVGVQGYHLEVGPLVVVDRRLLELGNPLLSPEN